LVIFDNQEVVVIATVSEKFPYGQLTLKILYYFLISCKPIFLFSRKKFQTEMRKVGKFKNHQTQNEIIESEGFI
jgi:hypothetical protein